MIILPVYFIGHGSPMNAIANNSFTQALNRMRQSSPLPKCIVCISAHWQTNGTYITHMPYPKTIHDFYGFPKELFAIQYPAPGSSTTAEMICDLLALPRHHCDDDQWGLDHGTWSVLRHLYPNANIPIIQLSLNQEASPFEHFQIGKKLCALREQGILIIGSGNIVHNLQQILWSSDAQPYEWAVEYDEWVKKCLLEFNFNELWENFLKSPSGKLSVPTLEHYLPLLYVIGAANKSDQLKFEYEGIDHGSISMRTFSFNSETKS